MVWGGGSPLTLTMGGAQSSPSGLSLAPEMVGSSVRPWHPEIAITSGAVMLGVVVGLVPLALATVEYRKSDLLTTITDATSISHAWDSNDARLRTFDLAG